MTMWRVKCNTENLLRFVESETEPTECPVDNCGNFTCSEEK